MLAYAFTIHPESNALVPDELSGADRLIDGGDLLSTCFNFELEYGIGHILMLAPST
jgi:hypothetical protein